MKTYNSPPNPVTTAVAQYRTLWLVYVRGRKEPFELNELQYEALKGAVAEGRSIVFFRDFSIGLPFNYSEAIRTPISSTEEGEWIPVEPNPNDIYSYNQMKWVPKK
jgi:hypothetical protein